MSKVNLISKEEAVKKIEDSISSIFSKEDVIGLIKQIAAGDSEDDEDNETYTKKEVKKMLETVKETIVNNIEYSLSIDDLCNLDDVELSLSGREIELDTSNVDLDTSSITDNVESTIDDYINNL